MEDPHLKKEKINIVWLKRDLRTQDQHPLYAAELMQIPYLIIYCFEPILYKEQDVAMRHLQFVYHSIKGINNTLSNFNKEVSVFHLNALEAFTHLQNQFDIQAVFSYQESGTKATWDRDKSLNTFFISENIEWKEYQRDNVIRGISNRIGWDQEWLKTMQLNVLLNTYTKNTSIAYKSPFPLPVTLKKELEKYPIQLQPAGEYNAWRYINSFATKRGSNYFKHISKPLESRTGCSRISPYLAWGNISIKQAYHFINNHPNYNNHKRAFNAFLMRLRWHCHFVQKFEVECDYETQCLNSGYEDMQHETSPKIIEAWKNGLTGFPLVDACMRCVAETGWINFRMRAMVVSILCHHLDVDWRDGVYHLAQQFLDYDPGIHYPQFQMQAGTTGTNLVRIYNPIKQSLDHDPHGIFIRKWVPELQDVPDSFIHEPYTMTAIDQVFCGVEIGKDYPYPVVDLKQAGKIARKKMWGHKKKPLVKKEKKRILETHIRPKK